MKSKLDSIPGVGIKTKTLLARGFGSEEKTYETIKSGNTQAICAIKGITQKKALEIVRSFRQNIEGGWILKTPAANEIYEQILRLVEEYPITKKGKELVSRYIPHTDKNLMEKNLAEIIYSMSLNDAEVKKLRSQLENIRELKTAKKLFYDDRVILATDEKSYETLNKEYSKHCGVHLIESYSEIHEHIGNRIYVIDSGESENENPPIGDEEGMITTLSLSEVSVHEILPEVVLADFIANRREIRGIKELSVALESIKELRGFGEKIDTRFLGDVNLELFDEDCSIIEGVNNEIDSCRKIIYALKSKADETSKAINADIISRVEKDGITVSGSKLLQMAAMEFEVSKIMPNLKETIAKTIRKHANQLTEELKLQTHALKIMELFTESYPCQIDQEILEALIDDAKTTKTELEHKIKANAAKKLKDKYSKLAEAMHTIAELDLYLALGAFAREYNLKKPTYSDKIEFKNARNLFLNREKQQKISYILGGSKNEKEKITVLTGANSGGKTTLIKTLAQIQILAQMGFPVPAEEAEIPILDEVYYIDKYVGVMDAGAFEEMLETLIPVVVKKTRKLVLVDELEAITEPGAAANILASILEMLSETDCYAVFITHLSEEILPHLNKDIRVDGIEASGLDEDLNLIVDRQPKFGVVGKSTPELIIQRLFMMSDDEEKNAYKRILDNFKFKDVKTN